MRKINLTLEFEDNDLVEYALRKELDALLGKSIIDIRTLPNTKELYDNDNHFKSLYKAKKDLQLQIDRYVNNRNIRKD